MSYTIAFDIGGTNFRAGVVQDGKVLAVAAMPAPQIKAGGNGRATLDTIVYLLHKVSKKISKEKISAISIGVPGLVSAGKVTARNLMLNEFPLQSELQKRYGLRKKVPVSMSNDADCFALAESIYGAGKKYKHVYCLTLGTGIGGGLVINKHLYKGAGNASEPDRMTIKFDGIKDQFGNSGEFEEYCSIRGILRIAKEHDLDVKTPLEVYNLAKEKNENALASWKEYGFYLGVGLTNVINLLNPEIIILGGGLSNAWPYFKQEMFKTVKERSLFKDTLVVQSHLKDAGILGASLLAKK